jgi:3-dehydro-L-gulonate 2-dehydrogenase
MLSGGKATYEIAPDALKELGQSQVFLAVHAGALGSASMAEMERVVQGAVDALHAAVPVEDGQGVRYPGEGTLRVRAESLREGVVVEDGAWEGLVGLEG